MASACRTSAPLGYVLGHVGAHDDRGPAACRFGALPASRPVSMPDAVRRHGRWPGSMSGRTPMASAPRLLACSPGMSTWASGARRPGRRRPQQLRQRPAHRRSSPPQTTTTFLASASAPAHSRPAPGRRWTRPPVEERGRGLPRQQRRCGCGAPGTAARPAPMLNSLAPHRCAARRMLQDRPRASAPGAARPPCTMTSASLMSVMRPGVIGHRRHLLAAHPVIHVGRAHHVAGQLLEQVRLFVGQPAAADEADALGAVVPAMACAAGWRSPSAPRSSSRGDQLAAPCA